jgi:hypothetical protein
MVSCALVVRMPGLPTFVELVLRAPPVPLPWMVRELPPPRSIPSRSNAFPLRSSTATQFDAIANRVAVLLMGPVRVTLVGVVKSPVHVASAADKSL